MHIDRKYYARISQHPIEQLYGAVMDVKPFFHATKCCIETQQLIRQGQTQLTDMKMGAATILPNVDRLFVSKKPKKRNMVQMGLYGQPKVSPVKKKKKKMTVLLIGLKKFKN